MNYDEDKATQTEGCYCEWSYGTAPRPSEPGWNPNCPVHGYY